MPFPEKLGTLYRTFDGGELQGEVMLFPLHGPEGAPSVLEKTRLKLESLPAAGVWRIGVKGPHRQLFAARKSAMVEQADSPLPGWAESLSEDDWIYGTWETEKRELRLYRTLQTMLEVLVPPAEVEEFGDRTFARALSAVQGALSDLSVEYDEDTRPKAEAVAESEEEEEEAAEEEGYTFRLVHSRHPLLLRLLPDRCLWCHARTLSPAWGSGLLTHPTSAAPARPAGASASKPSKLRRRPSESSAAPGKTRANAHVFLRHASWSRVVHP
ncbi:hypothetical protein KYC5002_26605 [Archangium violaceum]|uniref:hypothetical protein n=1 Tax=Archangium violaceum TaxID=83451 RepID=UPI002B2EA28F|nr:hypothetical protein KYC5002_26605 [Archangium gephyra]